jgi:hypothetical protein
MHTTMSAALAITLVRLIELVQTPTPIVVLVMADPTQSARHSRLGLRRASFSADDFRTYSRISRGLHAFVRIVRDQV